MTETKAFKDGSIQYHYSASANHKEKPSTDLLEEQFER